MLRPVASPGGHHVAWITLNGELQIAVLPSDGVQTSKSTTLRLAPTIRTLLPKVRFMRWSNAIYVDSVAGDTEDLVMSTATVTLKLILASDYRVVVLELDTSGRSSSSIEMLGVRMDVEFPAHHGKISAMDFVFDHNSAVVLFDVAPHASILSLTQAHRNDIPNRKFSAAQGYAIAQRRSSAEYDPTTSVLALLVRDKHNDEVVVMERGIVVSTFKPDTIDAQGIMWSPDGKPMLMVWDSPAYGTKLNFFSALGHPLKQLTIGSETSVPMGLSIDFSGTGVSAIEWIRKAGSRNVTTLAVGNGSKQIYLRAQDSQSLTITSRSFQHPTALNSSNTTIWQHLGLGTYRPVEGVWDIGTDSVGEVEFVAISPDGQRVASKLYGCPNVIFIWCPPEKAVSAAIIYDKEVRQLVWDGVFGRLIIVTADNTASFHYWYDVNEPPLQVFPSRLKGLTSSRWAGQLLRNESILDMGKSSSARSFFMMSSTNYIDIVHLEDPSFPSVFETSSPDRNESRLDFTQASNGTDGRSMQPASSSRASAGSSIFF